MNRTAARANRSARSGTRIVIQLPTTMPGMEPVSSHPTMAVSTEPMIQWPMPAISVNGTACAMSEPTMRGVESRGERMISAVAPMAPAPTYETETSTPRTPPATTVRVAARRSASSGKRAPK
jgi:hypothetical protein